MDTEDLISLGAAAGLGLLVGLQRERSGHTVAGFRTFALITVLGTLCALLSEEFGGWVLGAGLLALGAAVVAGAVLAARNGEDGHPGITTEVGAVVMFVVGAMVTVNLTAAVAVGVGVAVLLQAKKELHGLASRLGEKDMMAVLQFAAATFVILPLLPDEAMGPYDALNPRKIWLLVVLVVGISLGAYVAYKLLGPRGGTLAGGLLGGAISSTATTVSYARQAGEAGDAAARTSAVVILLASAVLYARVLIMVGVVAPAFLAAAAWPLGAMLAFSGIVAVVAWWLSGRDGGELPERKNPSELKAALIFAGIFAVVLVAVEAATEWLGGAGLYAVAVISGTVDMDAITLSTARMAGHEEVEPTTAWRAVIIASLANLLSKWAIAWWLGGRTLALRLLPYFGAVLLFGAGVVVAWPEGGAPADPGRDTRNAEPGEAAP